MALGFNGVAACSEYSSHASARAAGPGRSAGPQPVGIQSINDFATPRSALDSDSFGTAPQTRSLRIGEDRNLHYLVALMAEELERLG